MCIACACVCTLAKVLSQLTYLIGQLLSSSVVGNTVCGCGGYKVNGVTGDDEVGDVTGDDVW